MRKRVGLILPFILLLCTFTATAQTTQPGVAFTIVNGCSAPVRGFAVGDEVCLLKVGTAVYTRGIFQGTMVAGEKKEGMACADKDGNGSVIFVPWAGAGIDAVIVTVKPNEVVNIPKTFCSTTKGAAEQLRHKQ